MCITCLYVKSGTAGKGFYILVMQIQLTDDSLLLVRQLADGSVYTQSGICFRNIIVLIGNRICKGFVGIQSITIKQAAFLMQPV